MAQPYIDLLRSAELHPLRGTGGVPSTRTVTVTGLPLIATGGPLGTADVNIDIAVTPASVSVVGSARTITCTAPLLIGGGASADLTANRTLSVAVFAGTTPGVVPTGTNDASLFLAQTGWTAGTVVGVSSVTGTAPIVVAPTTGAAVVSISAATLSTPGHVPAVGTVDATQALIRTNPPTWGTVGLTGFIQLQGSYPGTAQTGNGHITGTFGAQTGIVVGDEQLRGGWGLGNVYIKQASPSSHPTVVSIYSLGGSINAGMTFLAARGTVTVPANTATTDQLASLSVGAWQTSGFSTQEVLSVSQDGSAGAHTPKSVTLRSWDSTGGSSNYLFLSGHSLAGINTVAPLSGFEIATTLGLKILEKTSSFTVDETAEPGCMYLLDPSGGTCRATLHTAGTRTGRIYGFTNINNALTPGIASIRGSGGTELINGVNEVYLPAYGDTIWIQSDGSNWVVVHNGIQMYQAAIRSDMSPVGASSTAEVICGSATVYNGTSLGTVFGVKAYGTYSTNATPNMTFRVRVGTVSGTIMQTFGVVPGASGVTDALWELDASWVVETIVAGACTVGRALSARLAIGDAAGASTVRGGTLYTPAASFGAAGTLGLKLTHQFGTSHGDNDVTTRAFATWVQPGTYYAF